MTDATKTQFPTAARPDSPHVGFLVTCLVDAFRPTVGFAAIALLEAAGCRVSVPERQTCCGQPAYNSGDREGARALARQVIAEFEHFDYVVAPSGSCTATASHHYPALFDGESGDDPAWAERARKFAAKTFELVAFLVDVMGWDGVTATCPGIATYHDSCSGLRELGIKAQPRQLLTKVEGLTVRELAEPEECCGFGGTFCVKYTDISNRMVSSKAEDIIATGADMVLAGDVGCLLNMAGKLKRLGPPAADIQVRHVAEVLAGMTDVPPIGDPPIGQKD